MKWMKKEDEGLALFLSLSALLPKIPAVNSHEQNLAGTYKSIAKTQIWNGNSFSEAMLAKRNPFRNFSNKLNENQS